MGFQDIVEEFVIEDIETVIKRSFGSVLNDTMYNPKKLNNCSNNIIAGALKRFYIGPINIR